MWAQPSVEYFSHLKFAEVLKLLIKWEGVETTFQSTEIYSKNWVWAASFTNVEIQMQSHIRHDEAFFFLVATWNISVWFQNGVTENTLFKLGRKQAISLYDVVAFFPLLRKLFIYVSKSSENESLPRKLCALYLKETNFQFIVFFSLHRMKIWNEYTSQRSSVIYISVFRIKYLYPLIIIHCRFDYKKTTLFDAREYIQVSNDGFESSSTFFNSYLTQKKT